MDSLGQLTTYRQTEFPRFPKCLIFVSFFHIKLFISLFSHYYIQLQPYICRHTTGTLPHQNNCCIHTYFAFIENTILRKSCTIFISAADQRIALRAWPNHSGGRHSNAVMGPFFQPLQHHLLFAGRDCGLLYELLINTDTF